jgi:hypothetical protein
VRLKNRLTAGYVNHANSQNIGVKMNGSVNRAVAGSAAIRF